MINLVSPKTTKKSKRVGRGIGSGKGGHTTGRGTKGQRSRSGYTKPRPGFEGGQNPLSKRLPKLRGLSNAARTRKFKTNKYSDVVVNLSDLSSAFKKDESVTLESLQEKGLVGASSIKRLSVKILFDKDIDKALKIEGVAISKTAAASVEKAGGSVSK